jgi:hypothetical protein
VAEKQINIGYLSSSNEIITLRLYDKVNIEPEDIKELHLANQKLLEGNKYSLLVVAGKYSNVTAEARELAAQKEFSANRVALAFVTNQLAQKFLVNFFIRFNKSNTPTKLFTDEKEAIRWLRGKSKKRKSLA